MVISVLGWYYLIRTWGCGNSSKLLLPSYGQVFSTVQDRKKAGSRAKNSSVAHTSRIGEQHGD